MFDIHAHILDHAQFSLGSLAEGGKKLVHFNTSVDVSYFLKQGIVHQEGIDAVMISILKNIERKKIKVREKNGTYCKKDGQVVQKYRIRVIRFDEILLAYHNRHFDAAKSVNPHFHFLFGQKSRVGKDFIYLKRVIEEEAQNHYIRFNFMEKKKPTGLSKGQQISIEKMSWILNQGNPKKILQYLSQPIRLARTLDLLLIHYENTQNISYFIKILTILHQRLMEYDIDFVYRDTNLKKSIFFLLDERQQLLLRALQKQTPIQLDLHYVFDREILKYTYGFQSDVMDILSDRFNISTISKQQLILQDKQHPNSKKAKTNNFRASIIKDLRNTLAYAEDEKAWKHALMDMGYTKVSIKSRRTSTGKREKIGLTIITKKKTKLFIPFHHIRINYKKMLTIMMFNKRKNRLKHDIESLLDDYKTKEKRQRFLTRYEHQMTTLLMLYSDDATKTLDTKTLQNLAIKYTIDRSDMYDITTFKNKTTLFSDYQNRIVLHKATEHEKKSSVSDMLDLAVIKGWDLQTLSIKGTDTFVKEVKMQIQHRTQQNISHQPQIEGGLTM